ncbi:type II secretion system protein [Sulfurovum sp. XGS-02]|uniref:type II secretion system protein n=1 Tax=Sulfurovum sp. XGS-02 TaxID=2925411 RepID=UPI002069CB6B|nr:type II secretion system protein [Sulfurovum sp. XGS-02]UPT77136.1 type II secretion system protein [Sulfurovum sp. XGS-02]
MNKKQLRPAIAMIELIFAIVIMGIILMSAPMLISTAAKSGYVAIQQEAINEAASRVNMIMGYHWDENSADETVLDPILQTASPVTDLAEATYLDGNGTGRRVGTPLESYRSFIRPDGSRLTATAAAGLGNDGLENDMDDFIGTIGLNLAGTGTGTNYIEKNVTIDTAVFYISDTTAYNPAGNTINFNADFTQESLTTTNIKRISTTLTSDAASPDELDKIIILHAFSCNIGGYKLEERDF